MSTKTLLSSKKITKVGKAKQKFVRINIDLKLDNILSALEEEYPLFGRSDIIRMLLSKSIRAMEKLESKQPQTLKQVMEGASFIDIETENEQFEFLRQNGIMK